MSTPVFEREEWVGIETTCSIPGKYGFMVAVEDRDYNDDPVEPKITVSLPHQCDRWEIVWEVDSKEKARAALTAFIEEAKKALEVIDHAPIKES